MLDSIHENKTEYAGQLTVYNGYVNVSIICTNSFYYISNVKLWISVMNKSFGKFFRSSPRESDWVKAKKWMDEQLALINKYATDIKVKPQELDYHAKDDETM
jgi:hypothetical protein